MSENNLDQEILNIKIGERLWVDYFGTLRPGIYIGDGMAKVYERGRVELGSRMLWRKRTVAPDVWIWILDILNSR